MACKRDIKVLLIDKVAELSKTNSISKVNTMFGTEVIKPSGRIFIPSSLIDIYWNKYNEVKNKPVTPEKREISLTPNIKPGVAELFESNESLANSVYEALGFTPSMKETLAPKNINETFLDSSKGLIDYLKSNFKGFDFLFPFIEKYNIKLDIQNNFSVNHNFASGGYNWITNTIVFDKDLFFQSDSFERTLLHEIIHGILRNKYIEQSGKKTLNQQEFKVDIDDYIKSILPQLKEASKNNKRLNDIYEIIQESSEEVITYGLTDKEFINFLKNTPSNLTTTIREVRKTNTLWDIFYDIISKIFGKSNLTRNKLEELTDLLNDVLEVNYTENGLTFNNIEYQQITLQQKQQAQQLYSQYLEQNPNGNVEQFKSWVDEFNKKTNIQGAYDFSASSNSGKWNSANNELLNLVQDNRKAFAIYKFLIGDMETFKEIVDFLNEKGIKIPYTDRMKRADETMTIEERKSAIDSYNNSVTSKVENKAQIEKDILSENNLQDETEYTPQELIEKYPLIGVQKVIWNLIKDIVNKLGIKVKFSSSRITEGFDGSNNPLNGEILIRPSTLKNGRFGEVLVHEVVHALTTKIISRVNSGITTGLTQKQINAVKGLMKLFEAVKADNNLENKYPVKDVFEFIAHLTNEKFVKELESKDKNFLQKVVDFILDIVGITNANELSKKYLLDIISDGVFLQENGVTVLPSDYGSNVQGSLSDFISQKSQERLNQIQDIFNEYPELNRIGSIQQYASYLDTIFPDSKVKDIVYHGSDNIFETFDKNVLGKNTQAESAKKGFFFSKNPKTSEDYIEFSPKRLKIEPASTLQGYEGETRLINKYRDKIPSNYIKKDIIYEEGFREEIEIINPQYRKDVESILPGIFKYNVYHDNSERNIGDAFANPLNYIKKLVTYQEAKDFIEDIKKSNEMSKLYMTLLDIKNPMLFSDNANIQRQNTYSERINKALSNKNDSVIIENTFDPYPNLTDIYVVFEPEQIYILGGKQDIEGFKQFVQNKQSITPRKGISELFAENPQLASIGTQEQYERYLSTIFPNSKVKDIVYHGSSIKGLQELKREKDSQGKMYTSRYGITFTDNDLTAMIYAGQISDNPEAEDNLDNGQVYSVILNVKNPEIQDFNNESYGGKFGSAMGTYNNALEKAVKEGKDSFIAKRIADPVQNQTNIVVFEPEQIHILSSKADIEGFKQFVSSRLGQQGNIFYQNLSESNLQDYVASEKTIRDLAARMSDRIGIPVLFEFDTTKEYKGKLKNNTAIINLAYATLDTPIHEILGHPIIRAIKNKEKFNLAYSDSKIINGKFFINNKEITKDEYFDLHKKFENNNFKISQLYQNLLKELETGKGKEVLDRIKRDYVNKEGKLKYKDAGNKLDVIEISTGKRLTFFNEESKRKALQEKFIGDKYTLEEQQEEAIVELLGLYTADRLDKVKDGKLISLLKRLLKEMKAFMKSLFNQKEVEIDKLPDNMTLGDLADLLAYSNSKLILPGNEVIYTIGDGLEFKTYAEINNHIKELARQAAKYENVDLSKVEIDNEDFYLKRFLEADKEYAQARKIIDTWKEVNDIQYNPEEAYSRGQEFIHVHNAYGNTDTITWLQNLIPNLEDINKANGVMEMSFLTYFQGKLPKHVTRHLNEKAVIKIIAYPKSKDIAFASKIDNYTSSYSIDSEGLQYFIDLSNISKREQLAVSYTKSVKLRNIDTIEPNIADTIDNVAHHNEYAINIADGNFRIEYGKETPYDIKKLIDNINSILDQKYGKLVKPEIKKTGIQPTQTNETLKESIESVKNKTLGIFDNSKYVHPELGFMDGYNNFESDEFKLDTDTFKLLYNVDKKTYNVVRKFPNYWQAVSKSNLEYYSNIKGVQVSKIIEEQKKLLNEKIEKYNKKEYTSQALINTKVATLKQVAKKYPRSLIRSEIVKIKIENYNEIITWSEKDILDLPFQKISTNKDIEMKMLPDDIKGEYDIFLDELNDSDVNPIFKGTQGETLVDENNNLCALK